MQVPITILTRNDEQMINARELHSFLEVGRDFSTWVKDRVEKFDFKENLDFIVFTNLGGNPSQGGRPQKEYEITLDMAKELAMVENNEKGKEARRYFISVEKAARLLAQSPDDRLKDAIKNMGVKDVAVLLLQTAEENERLQRENEKLEETKVLQEKELKKAAPKVEYVNKVLESESTHSTTIIAKELGMSAMELNKTLAAMNVLYRQGDTWVLYSKYQDKGLTKTRTSTYTDASGQSRTSILTVWTEAGRAFIHRLLNPDIANKIQLNNGNARP
jgi:anti-repressor protein